MGSKQAAPMMDMQSAIEQSLTDEQNKPAGEANKPMTIDDIKSQIQQISVDLKQVLSALDNVLPPSGVAEGV